MTDSASAPTPPFRLTVTGDGQARGHVVEPKIERATADQPWWVTLGGRLLQAACGDGYISERELQSLADRDDTAVLLASETAQLLGLSLAAVADHTTRTQLTRSLAALGIDDAIADTLPCGWLRAVVVAPTARGHGIGDLAIKAALSFLEQKRCRTVYAVSWISGTGQQSDGILARNGFDALGTIQNYWSDILDYSGSCAVCGTPCRCSAIIMRRTR